MIDTKAHESTPATLKRFIAKYDSKPNGCWEWKAFVDNHGYGMFRHTLAGRTMLKAHRFAYELVYGYTPLPLDHLCRNTKCVNPTHLEPVTHQVNVLRGVGPTAKNHLKTHCPRGHAYTAENTHVTPNGGRSCKACWPINNHKYYKPKGVSSVPR